MITRGLILLLVSLLLPQSVFAAFARGNKYDFVTVEGKITLRCDNKRRVVDCRDTFMEPWPYDIFIGPKNSAADSVELRVDSDGSQQTSVASYDGELGRSSEFNLGVYSVFSRPLLKVGRNNINYTIFNANERKITSGKFVVNVGRLPTRKCRTREIPNININDCEYTYSICQQYFKALNYCR